MNLYKLILSFIFIFPFLTSDFGECLFLKKKLLLANQLYFYHVFLVPWILAPKSIFLTLLLAKLLGIKSTVIVGQSVAVGALLLGTASALLLGTIGGITLSHKLRKLHLLKKMYFRKMILPLWQQGVKRGRGWPRIPNTNVQVPYYRWPTYQNNVKLWQTHGQAGITNLRKQPRRPKFVLKYSPTFGRNSSTTFGRNSSTKSAFVNRFAQSAGQAIIDFQEVEALLQKEFRKLGMSNLDANGKEEMEIYKLIVCLREAYKLRLLMDKLSIPSGQGIPDFIPFPKIVSKSKESTRQKRSSQKSLSNDKQQSFIENLFWETNGFFEILSTFDRDSCIQKLVCEVHAKEARQSTQSLHQYDRNLISMFTFVNTLFGDYQGSSMKYRDAANFGKVNNYDSCRQRYLSCGYSSEQIIKMGKHLD